MHSLPGRFPCMVLGGGLLTCLLALGGPASAQSASKLAYDLNTGAVTFDEAYLERGGLHRDGTLVVVVENVNPLLYDVEISGVPVRFTGEEPRIFSSELSPRPAALESPPAGDTVGLRPPDPAQTDREADFWDAMTAFRSALVQLYSVNVIETTVVDLMYSDGSTPYQIEKEMKRYLKRVLGNIEDPAPAEVSLVATERLDQVERAHVATVAAYSNLDSASATATSALEDSRQAYEEFNDDLATLTAAYANISSLLQRARLGRFTIPSGPIGVHGNAMRVTVEVSRRDGLDPRHSTSRGFEREFQLPVYGGLDVDFSAGFFVNSVHDRSYGIEKEKIARRGSEPGASVTVGSLVHVSHNSDWLVRPAAAFGLGTDTAGRLAYFAGGSLILGRGQRWVVSVGSIAASASRLGGGLEIGDALVGEDRAIPTEDALDLGWFVGFSYSLTGVGGGS